MQIAQSRKQVRISKPRALEQDSFNTKGDELLPNAPSCWKECVLHTCLGPSAPDSWWVILPLPKLEEMVHRACLTSCWNCWIQKSREQSPGLPIFSAASIQFLFKAHVQEATLIFPWKEREYGSPPGSGGKEKFSSPEDSPEIQQGKGSHWWAKLVCWREGSRWTLYPPPPASHCLVCTYTALITHLFLQVKAVPPPRMDFGTNNAFKIHKKLYQQS